MKILLVKALILPLMVFLSGCGWFFGDEGMFRDRGDDYRKASLEPPLSIPLEKDDVAIDDRYAVPPTNEQIELQGEFVVPRPMPMDEVMQADAVRLNRLSEQQWILANGAPGQIWPRLRGFLNLNSIPVGRADAVNGIIETDWLQPRGEDVLAERFQFRIEQGVQRGTTEIYVLQMVRNATGNAWPKVSSTPEREDLMLRELAQFLADSAAAASVSMLAQRGLDNTGKVKIEQAADQSPQIRLQLSFVRAWLRWGWRWKKPGFWLKTLIASSRFTMSAIRRYLPTTISRGSSPGCLVLPTT